MVHYPFDKKSWDISNSPNPCWARHVQNLCSCYFFTKLNLVLAMFCSLPLMHSIHYVSCCITKSRICKTHLLKLCQGYSKIIWILDWATHVFTICMSDQPQRRQSSSSRIKYFTAKVKILQHISLLWLHFSHQRSVTLFYGTWSQKCFYSFIVKSYSKRMSVSSISK